MNLATGARIDQDGLVRLAPQYTREYLATFTFRQFVSAFEAFLSSRLLYPAWTGMHTCSSSFSQRSWSKSARFGKGWPCGSASVTAPSQRGKP